jgi:hypothetical protein
MTSKARVSETGTVAGIFRLSNGDMRRAVYRLLLWIREQYDARSVSLWRAQGGALWLEFSVFLDHETMNGATRLWERGLAGHVPVIGPRSKALLVARGLPNSYIYLEGVDARWIDADSIGGLAAVAVGALRAAAVAPGMPRALERLVLREDLISTLSVNEWNLARVARVKGVSRTTVYDWMDKYQIPRERVLKTPATIRRHAAQTAPAVQV